MTRLSLPLPPPPPATAIAAPVDLYRKRKLAQRAQQHANTAAERTADDNDSSTAKKLRPLAIALPTRPPSPPPSKPSANAVSSPVHRLAQRQKQLDLGYATAAYKLYVQRVSLEQRDERKREDGHPTTPRKEQSCSKRSWDGQVRKWRRQLHEWDEGGRMFLACTATGESEELLAQPTVDAVDGGSASNGMGGSAQAELQEVGGVECDEDDRDRDEDVDEDEDDWRESILRMAGALPD